MSKFLKIAAPAGIGIVGILGTAYMMADQFVTDMPAPLRGNIVVPAAAEIVVNTAGEEVEVADPVVIEVSEPAPSREGGFGLGREAHPEEVAAWDIDVRPDGQGLPEGRGSVFDGERLYLINCALCHGDFGEAIGRWPVLSGGEGSIGSEDPVKTIGSYWPYASTIWDYVHRAMPFGNAESLSDDEVYAITAYLLYLNYLVEDDFILSNENFSEITMPNEPNFMDDDRVVGEIPAFTYEPCMENCKEEVEITSHAAVLDVTPDTDETEGNDRAAITSDTAEASSRFSEAAQVAGENTTPVVSSGEEEPAAEEPAAEVAEVDPALVEAGEGVFRKCRSCHQIGEGARHRTGPELNGIVGRAIASADGFNYSGVMADAGAEGRVWSADELAAFLADPRGSMRGTKMSFAGLSEQEEIDAIIAYMSTFE